VTRKIKARFVWLWLLGSGFFLATLPYPAVAAESLQIKPQSIEIGAVFSGAQITLSDVIPRDGEAVVEVIGQVKEEDLMRKGRRWELWMNTGEIDIKGAPSFYQILSSAPQLLDDGRDHPWGYSALSQKVSFIGRHRKDEEPLLFTEFIQLKEGQRVYGQFPGSLRLSPLNGTEVKVDGAFHLPARVSPGTYQVCLSVIQNGEVRERRCQPLEVTMVGLPRFLAALASQNAVLYGLLCVATATAFGFLSGVFFGKIKLGAKPKDEC
jgi:Putative transmembrane protein (Alph_Pro_TM)